MDAAASGSAFFCTRGSEGAGPGESGAGALRERCDLTF